MSTQSGIIRTVKDKDHPYRLMNIAPLQNKELSWEARGMLGFLLSKPDNWQVRVENLIEESPNAKRDKVQGILAELEDARYIVRRLRRDEHGHFTWESAVYETPQDVSADPTVHKRKQRKPRKVRARQPKQEIPVMVENAPESDPSITGDTVTGFTVNGTSVDGEPAHIKDMDSKIHGDHDRASRSRARTTPSKEQKEVSLKTQIERAYVDAIGYTPVTFGPEAAAAKRLAASGYTPEQVADCYQHMLTSEFWANKAAAGEHISLQSVAKNIGAFVAMKQKKAQKPAAKTHYYRPADDNRLSAEESAALLRAALNGGTK